MNRIWNRNRVKIRIWGGILLGLGIELGLN